MKHIFRYIFSTVVMLVPVLAFAQNTQLDDPDIYSGYNHSGGVATAKSVGDIEEGGLYTITLETFATGLTSIITKAIPSDIILLLDYSSSMLTNDNITKLKQAVVTFVQQIQDNNDELPLEEGQMGNRIAFVLYAGLLYDDYPETTQHVNNNNSLPLLNDYPYFNAQYVNQFIEVDDLTATGSSVMYNNVNIISPSSQHDEHPYYLGRGDYGDTNKGTNTPAAMAKALELVNANQAAYSSSARSTTVVLFTDGEPCNIYQSYYGGTGSSGFTASYANDCLADAKTIKGKGVKIFSVGLFNYNGNNSQANRQTRTFVEYTSSNYPDIAPTSTSYWTNNSNLLNIDDPMSGDYCSIVSSGANLSGVFQTIAEASGGSESQIPGQTQVVDCVSNSFKVPASTQFSDIKVYYREVNKAGNAWGELVELNVVEAKSTDNPFTASYITDESKVGVSLEDGVITVLGFNYSKPDTEGVTPYDGNWVGWRDEDDCSGKELVIKFKIEANPDATGGDGSNTNTADSGVYVPIFNEDGTEILGYQPVNKYEVPRADIPLNIVIKKDGLRAGESATIQIYRSHQAVDSEGKPVPHATTGKPMPVATMPTSPNQDPNDLGWENFTKVILTNTTGVDGATVTKTLLCLYPDYVYLLKEDDWGWSYVLDTKTLSTAEVEMNPFTFTNTEKTDAVKHAEAVSINHFGAGAHADTYKSSKTKNFTSGQ